MSLHIKDVFLKPSADQKEMERLVAKASGEKKSFPRPGPIPLWNETFFGFSKSKLWRALASENKREILSDLQAGLLTETYFIESAGMSFAAKMNLLSESLVERQFFCLMGAEEASHFESLKPFFPKDVGTTAEPSSFAALIGKIVGEGDRLAGLSLIQVLLEGWGLSYYQALASACQSADLNHVFTEILHDETRHHAAGVLIFRKQERGTLSSFIGDSLEALLQMVQVGPVTAAANLLRAANCESLSDAEVLLIDMSAVSETRVKLQRLRTLLARILRSDELEKFEPLFTPISEREMARISLSS